PHGTNGESCVLDALYDAAGATSRDGVGLYDGECAFHIRRIICEWMSTKARSRETSRRIIRSRGTQTPNTSTTRGCPKTATRWRKTCSAPPSTKHRGRGRGHRSSAARRYT